MKFLCIDTCGSTTAVGALGERKAYKCDDGFLKASRALMPMTDETLKEAGISINDVDFISAAVGPGSFTGIRIGVSAARALAYVLKVPLVPINSCELAAYNSRNAAKRSGKEKIMTLLDAGNGYAYAALYGIDGRQLSPIECLSSEELRDFAAKNSDCHIAADGVMSEAFSVTRAVGDGIIDLSAEKYRAGQTVGYADLVPLYVRRSQAES